MASLITLRGIGATDDPVIFPEHADCLNRAITADELLAAIGAAGATMDAVMSDPAVSAAVMQIIRERQKEKSTA